MLGRVNGSVAEQLNAFVKSVFKCVQSTMSMELFLLLLNMMAVDWNSRKRAERAKREERTRGPSQISPTGVTIRAVSGDTAVSEPMEHHIAEREGLGKFLN